MTLYVIRHGQTDFNAEGRFQGRMDIPLNAHGKRQAKGNGQKLAHLLALPLDRYHFVASPLSRARTTMDIIREQLNLDPQDFQCDQRLSEISFGDFEGQTVHELTIKHPDLMKQRNTDKWNFLHPGAGGESYAQLAKRVKAAMDDFHAPTICVCHGGVIRAILHNLGTSLEQSSNMSQVPQDQILTIEGDLINWV